MDLPRLIHDFVLVIINFFFFYHFKNKSKQHLLNICMVGMHQHVSNGFVSFLITLRKKIIIEMEFMLGDYILKIIIIF